MNWKISQKKVLLPAAIILCAVIGLAQMRSSGKLVKNLFRPTPAVKNENGSSERKRTNDDPWVELDKIYQVFQGDRHIFYAGRIQLTDEEGTTTLEDTDFSGEFSGNDYRQTIDSVELIHKGSVSINVYHRENLMVAGVENNIGHSFWMYSNLDSLKNIASQQKATAEVLWDKADKVIKIDNLGSSDVYGYEIFYNPIDYRVKKVVLSLATLNNYDEAEKDSDEKNANMETDNEESNAPDHSDTTALAPSIQFNLYKLELTYDQFYSKNDDTTFNPLKKYGTLDREGLHVNHEFKNYRVVWMGEERKKH